MNLLLIEAQFAEAIGTYLVNRPYFEVFHLIEGLKTLQKANIPSLPIELMEKIKEEEKGKK